MSVNKEKIINQHIKFKFFLPMIALAALCCLVVFILYSILFNKELNNAIFNKIDVAVMVTEHEINNLKANGRIAAIGIADNQDLIKAAENNDRNEIIKIANALVRMAQIDFCTIIDKEGYVIVRTHEPEIYGDKLSHLRHVEYALYGQREVYISQTITISLGVHAGSPIYDSKMNIIGAVSVGYRLNNPDFINNLKKITMCEIDIFNNDELTVSNDPETIFNNVPIRGADNEVLGMVRVGYHAKEEKKKIALFIFSGIIITLAVITGFLLLAKFIVKKVEHRLSDMMNEVRKADDATRKAIEEKNMLVSIREIMNIMDVMIFVTDPKKDNIIFMNDSMKRRYGITDDPTGKKCYFVLQGRKERCHFCPCKKLDKDPENLITWNQRNKFSNNIYRITDRYLKWFDGQIVHIQYSVDMTELINARESAELSNRSKGIFLAQMSHEIRTPMNAIWAFLKFN